MSPSVLQLDIQGTPQAWITCEQAALHYACESVAWTLGGDPLMVLRGGFNSQLGRQSTMPIAPIIAVRGSARRNLYDVEPTVTRSKIFRRDRMTCSYCNGIFPEKHLQVEHIIPQARGGAWSWGNLTSSCPSCNSRKGCRTPEEAGMPLLFLPYVPNRFEDFILQGRNIRGDVHEWLASRLPKGSRLQ